MSADPAVAEVEKAVATTTLASPADAHSVSADDAKSATSAPSSTSPAAPSAAAKQPLAATKRVQKRALLKCPKGTRDAEPHQMRIRDRAFRLVTGIFQRHGAVAIDTPVFELKETLTGKYGEDSKLIYDLADQGGEICALRYDLTVPFARYCAEHGVDHIKRYHIARVYRRDQPAMAKGRYREFFQTDFDIAGHYARMVPDSECVKVATEVLDALPIGGYVIKLNHRLLIDGIMEVCGVPEDKHRTICSAIDKLDKEQWDVVKKEMIGKGLTEAVADHIGTYVTKHKGEPRAVLDVVRKDALLSKSAKAVQAFDDLTLLFDYLTALRCIHRVSFDLSLARGLDYYTGLIYEAVLTSGTSSLGSIAAGGRYDGLVGMFSGKEVPAVGISIGIERIFTLLEEDEKRQSEARKSVVRKNDTAVLVCSVGPALLTRRMDTCAQLWAAGVNAEYVFDVEPSAKKQMDVAVKGGVPIVLWLGEAEEKDGVVKVKNMTRKDDERRVAKDELVGAVQQLLAEIQQAEREEEAKRKQQDEQKRS